MVLDALLAYLHFMAIFVLFAFLTTQAVLLRAPLDAGRVRLLRQSDLWYFGAAMVALATGLLRLWLGAKGTAFHVGAWPLYAKLALFIAVTLISIVPTLSFRRWRRALEREPAWQVPAAEQRRMRRFVMIEVHVGALIPVFAVMMARGIGY